MPYNIKRGVALVMSAELEALIGVIDQVFAAFKLPLVITSGVDGPHRPGSLHYKFRAIDVRKLFGNQELNNVWNNDGPIILGTIRTRCKERKIPVDIIEETDHIHFEYDERKA